MAERSRKHWWAVGRVCPTHSNPPFTLSDTALGQVPGIGLFEPFGSRALKTPIG